MYGVCMHACAIDMHALLLRCLHLRNTRYATCFVQHTATHCNTLQHAATHCNTLRYTARHCKMLRAVCFVCQRVSFRDSRIHPGNIFFLSSSAKVIQLQTTQTTHSFAHARYTQRCAHNKNTPDTYKKQHTPFKIKHTQHTTHTNTARENLRLPMRTSPV